MKTKTMTFKAPIELHEDVEEIVKNDVFFNKQTFVMKAVQEAVKKYNKEKAKG